MAALQALKNGEINLVFNTTDGTQALADSSSIRRAALTLKVPYYTTMAGAAAATQAIQALAGEGVTTCIEVGPGNVLAGLIRRIDRDLTALAIGDPESLAKAQEVLGNG